MIMQAVPETVKVKSLKLMRKAFHNSAATSPEANLKGLRINSFASSMKTNSR